VTCLLKGFVSVIVGAGLFCGAYFYVAEVVHGNIGASSRHYYRSANLALRGDGGTSPAMATPEAPHLVTHAPPTPSPPKASIALQSTVPEPVPAAPQPAPVVPTPSPAVPAAAMAHSPTPSPPSTAATPARPQSNAPEEPTIFCFAWTPRRTNDEKLLPYVRKQFEECDGYTFFTDSDSSEEGDIVRVEVPKTKRSRTDSLWLYHQNMVGLAPAWTYLISEEVYESYDWLINAELDHFFVASRARACIRRHLDILREGSSDERRSVNGPLMLAWGNVFVFSRKFVETMATKWDRLGRPIVEASNPGIGCPMMTLERATSTGSCEQDMAYPGLANMVGSGARKYGPDGCSQFRNSATGKTFPLSCWQDFPIGSDLAGQMNAVREIALMKNVNRSQIRQHCESRGPQVAAKCEILYRARDVPVMHNFKDAKLHALAQKLLIP